MITACHPIPETANNSIAEALGKEVSLLCTTPRHMDATQLDAETGADILLGAVGAVGTKRVSEHGGKGKRNGRIIATTFVQPSVLVRAAKHGRCGAGSNNSLGRW